MRACENNTRIRSASLAPRALPYRPRRSNSRENLELPARQTPSRNSLSFFNGWPAGVAFHLSLKRCSPHNIAPCTHGHNCYPLSKVPPLSAILPSIHFVCLVLLIRSLSPPPAPRLPPRCPAHRLPQYDRNLLACNGQNSMPSSFVGGSSGIVSGLMNDG